MLNLTRHLVILLLCLVSTVQAEEPVAEFLQALRRRGDFELAFYYLEKQPTEHFSPETQAIFLLESGITYAQGGALLLDSDAELRARSTAASQLRKFLKENSGHPRALQAQMVLGELLLHAGLLDVEANDSENVEKSAVVRTVIEETRGYLEQSLARYQTLWKSFPVYLPAEQVEERAMKAAVEEAYIRIQLDLAQCRFWEAQTFERDGPDAWRVLAQAGVEFEAIHQRYRSQIGGLLARLWQARCFQEQGTEQGIRIALGIYGEILEHHGESVAIQNLRDRALKFRLSCLNSIHRRDYQLVIQEAEAWLESWPDRASEPLGAAIKWELCTAFEQKAGAVGLEPEERLDLLSGAYSNAYSLSWARGVYAKRAAALMDRIGPILREAGRETAIPFPVTN